MQQSRIFTALLVALTLVGCGPTDVVETDVDVGTGAVLDAEGVEVENTTEDELLEEVMEAESEELSQAEALRLSYESAVAVRDLVAELADQFDPEARAALDEALVLFSEDIEALKYYVELSEREPLLEQDTVAVATLSSNIEEAMNLFAGVIELML